MNVSCGEGSFFFDMQHNLWNDQPPPSKKHKTVPPKPPNTYEKRPHHLPQSLKLDRWLEGGNDHTRCSDLLAYKRSKSCHPRHLRPLSSLKPPSKLLKAAHTCLNHIQSAPLIRPPPPPSQGLQGREGDCGSMLLACRDPLARSKRSAYMGVLNVVLICVLI